MLREAGCEVLVDRPKKMKLGCLNTNFELFH